MATWKKHVWDGLQRRDMRERLPFDGVFAILSQMEERLEIRQQFLEEVQSKSSESHPVKATSPTTVLQLQLKESHHVGRKKDATQNVPPRPRVGWVCFELSQAVSDLTVTLNLKEAELQYWQSRVSLHRKEALALVKGSKNLKESLSECEFIVERQAKELKALREERAGLKEALERTCTEKERLLHRWMEEKREEADRLNRYNDTQERWHHLASRMKKHLKRETKPLPGDTLVVVKEPFSSEIRGNSTTDAPPDDRA